MRESRVASKVALNNMAILVLFSNDFHVRALGGAAFLIHEEYYTTGHLTAAHFKEESGQFSV